jgi:hypothetical protein
MIRQEQVFGKMVAKKIEDIRQFMEDCRQQRKRLDQAERGLMRQLMEFGLRLLEEFVEGAGNGDLGPTLERNAIVLRRSEELHEKRYRSLFGVLVIHRYVYAVRERQKVQAAPLDEQLSLPAGEQSYALEDLTSRLATQMSYGEAVDWLGEWPGIKTTVRAAETMVSQLGKQVESFRASQPPVLPETEGEILVATADGKGVPMRRGLEQRLEEELGIPRHKRTHLTTYQKTSKRRSRGQQSSRKQMAYVGAVYSIDRWERTPEDLLDEVRRRTLKEERPPLRNKRLRAEMTQIIGKEVSDGAERLFAQLAGEVAVRGVRHPALLVCLMDGQKSLWELKKTYLPRAIGILDLYHVMEKLWKAAYAFHPESSLEAEEFVDRYLRMLLEGKVGYVIGVFRRFLKQYRLPAAKRKGLEEAVRYFKTNRQAMRYDEYLAAGYPIGSGVVEGACRHVVKDRMERTGMRWQIEGAQPLLDLRTAYLNGEWSALIEHRIQKEQATLYSTPT